MPIDNNSLILIIKLFRIDIFNINSQTITILNYRISVYIT